MQFSDRGKIGSSAFAKNIEVKHLNMYTFETCIKMLTGTGSKTWISFNKMHVYV